MGNGGLLNLPNEFIDPKDKRDRKIRKRIVDSVAENPKQI